MRPVATLGWGESSAFCRDGAALDAVGVVDGDIDRALGGSAVGNLINRRWAHPAPGLGQFARHAPLNPDVVGRIIAGGVAGDEYR